jgi:methylated-DNA-[protein]-cysteine S-methyltransferase
MDEASRSWISIPTELGIFAACATQESVVEVRLPSAPTVLIEHRDDSPAILVDAARQIVEFVSGRRRNFDLPVSASGTAFQEAVWSAVADVPWGETRSYAQIADAIERPASARPVGQAVGRNPLPLIWPCHRILASDGIGGYGGGLDLKRALLRLEGVAVDSGS